MLVEGQRERVPYGRPGFKSAGASPSASPERPPVTQAPVPTQVRMSATPVREARVELAVGAGVPYAPPKVHVQSQSVQREQRGDSHSHDWYRNMYRYATPSNSCTVHCSGTIDASRSTSPSSSTVCMRRSNTESNRSSPVCSEMHTTEGRGEQRPNVFAAERQRSSTLPSRARTDTDTDAPIRGFSGQRVQQQRQLEPQPPLPGLSDRCARSPEQHSTLLQFIYSITSMYAHS